MMRMAISPRFAIRIFLKSATGHVPLGAVFLSSAEGPALRRGTPPRATCRICERFAQSGLVGICRVGKNPARVGRGFTRAGGERGARFFVFNTIGLRRCRNLEKISVRFLLKKSGAVR